MPIDRFALVSRHDIRIGDNDMWTTVGNGEFCFTTDKTGLQTFSGNTLALIYSIIYNGTYMIQEIIITAVVACFVTRIPQIKMRAEM